MATPTSYQRVGATASDYDATVGKYALVFDGVDDALSTGSIDFTSTAAMTVVAGVRKLSDAAVGIIVESSIASNTNTGAFALSNSGWASANAKYGGSLYSSAYGYFDSPINFAAPITNVLTESLNISGGSAALDMKLRVNGAGQSLAIGGLLGTGNFGNYPLFVGSRAGTSLPFNGHLYSLVIRGASSTAAQITSAETYTANKTGITL